MESTAPSSMIATFVERLIEEQNFGKLEPAVLSEIQRDLEGQVEEAVNLAIIGQVPEQELDAFSTVLSTEDSVKIRTFLLRYIPQMDSLVATTLLNLRAAYLRQA